MHGDRIALSKQMIKAHRFFDFTRELPCALHADQRVVPDNIHSKRGRGIGNFDANRAQSDHA